MKAFLIYTGESFGSAGMAAIVFAASEQEAFERLVASRNKDEEGKVLYHVPSHDRWSHQERTLICRGPRWDGDANGWVDCENYRQAFRVEEVDVNNGDVILATDYYGPSLEHYGNQK